jgi:hypothetical protein
MANEIEKWNPRMALVLDRVSDRLENFKFSKIVNPQNIPLEELKDVEIEIQYKCASDFMANDILMASLVEAGLKNDFVDLLKKGRGAWKDALEKVKDKATIAQIKALNTVEKVKNFIEEHPGLKRTVLVAVILGMMAFPQSSKAEIISAPTEKVLSEKLTVNFSEDNGDYSMKIVITDDFVYDLIMLSLQNSKGVGIDSISKDLHRNLSQVITNKIEALGVEFPNKEWSDLYARAMVSILKIMREKYPELLDPSDITFLRHMWELGIKN